MYSFLLPLHSLFRWLVLAAIFYAIYRAYKGWLFDQPFTVFDNRVRHISATIAHIQLIFGVWLYFISPIVQYFLDNYKTAIHERQIRFFGMEHSSMMLLAIIIITIGSAVSKRKTSDKAKFRTLAISYTIAIIIILLNIPWSFSPLISRPLFRLFW